jgi:hypothetical protein
MKKSLKSRQVAPPGKGWRSWKPRVAAFLRRVFSRDPADSVAELTTREQDE